MLLSSLLALAPAAPVGGAGAGDGSGLLGALAPLALTFPARADTPVRHVGAGPLTDILHWADVNKACGLSRDQLAALMLTPTFLESGSGISVAASPMTLSRYDTQSGLYAFGNASTPYPKAFFHPGIGMWQFDSAGGWPLTAAGAINTDTAAQQASATMANGWCNGHTPKAAWGPWSGDCGNANCDTLLGLYNQIFDGTALVNIASDPSVGSLGGMEQRTCIVGGLGGATMPCSFVDPSKAQGSSSWASPNFGLSPISAPFYVLQSGGKEYRYWLKADTGYATTIMATKTVTANARTGLTWSTVDDLCDLSAQRGMCGNPLGAVDTTAAGGGSVLTSGWALDPNTSGPIPVLILVDGTFLSSATASTFRSDIGAAFPAAGPNHGFTVTVTGIAPGDHTLCAVGVDAVAPGVNTQVGCRTFTMPTGSPFGALDQVIGGSNQVEVSGWAIDPDTTGTIPVHVYIDGVGSIASTAVARGDIANAFPVYGSLHGYDVTITGVAPGVHNVCTYGINVGPTAVNTTLGCRTVRVVSGDPFGAFDSAAPGIARITVTGWGIDPDTTAPISVQVAVDGGAPSTATANVSRPDIGAAFPTSGPIHGFSVALTPLAGGVHNICVTVRNVGGGADVALGCRSATVLAGSPVGAFDSVAAGFGRATVAGWALDPDGPAPVTVTATVDGVARPAVAAVGNRPDIDAAFPGEGPAHGFNFPITPLGGGSHSVCITAHNAVGAGADATLGCRSVTVSPQPMGALDSVTPTGVGGSGDWIFSVAGWAIDPDTTAPISFRVVAGGLVLATGTANADRPDLTAAFPGYGAAHGIVADVEIPKTGLPGGSGPLCIVAVNVGGGSDQNVGCYNGP